VIRTINLSTEYETARRKLADWATSSGYDAKERRLQYGVSVKIRTPSGERSVALYHSAKRAGSRLVIAEPEIERADDLIEAMGALISETESASAAPISRSSSAVPAVHIGADESGKGDYFGPLVACAAFVGEGAEPRLRALGVRDSKELSDSEMQNIAPRIREICGHVALVAIGPERYNEMHHPKQMNVNSMLRWAHGEAISNVIAERESTGSSARGLTVVIDQFAKTESLMLAEQRQRGWNVRLVQMHRAESDLAVAAASILARVEFIHRLDRLSQSAGVRLPKGSGRIVDTAARELVRQQGSDALNRYAKRHFKNTTRVLQTALAG
jgi:ribonuclease HIII